MSVRGVRSVHHQRHGVQWACDCLIQSLCVYSCSCMYVCVSVSVCGLLKSLVSMSVCGLCCSLSLNVMKTCHSLHGWKSHLTRVLHSGRWPRKLARRWWHVLKARHRRLCRLTSQSSTQHCYSLTMM